MSLLVLKLIDSFVSSSSHIMMRNLKYKRVFVITFIKGMLFFFMINAVVSQSMEKLIMAAIAGAIGQTIPVYLAHRHEDKIDQEWEYEILIDSMDESKRTSDMLKNRCFDVETGIRYAAPGKKVLSIKVNAKTSDESKRLISSLPLGTKMKVIEPIRTFTIK